VNRAPVLLSLLFDPLICQTFISILLLNSLPATGRGRDPREGGGEEQQQQRKRREQGRDSPMFKN
jgi:hypothetical protein